MKQRINEKNDLNVKNYFMMNNKNSPFYDDS